MTPAPLRRRFPPVRALWLALAAAGCAPEGGEPRPAPPEAALAPAPTPVTAAALREAVRQTGAEAVVVNFWATWCVPCREEFPAFTRVGREFADRGVRVLFVSVDEPDRLDDVRAFLGRHGVTGTSYLKAEADFVRAFHERWTGALPATFVFDGEGNLETFWEGKTSFDDLQTRLAPLLAVNQTRR